MADDPNTSVDTGADVAGGDDVVITDRQLYDHAITDAKPEPAAPPAAAETPAPAGEEQPAGQRPRDGQGRFAPRPQAKAQPQAQQKQPEDHRVPLRQLLDEREQRQRYQAEAEQLRQAWAQLQQQAAAQQQPQTIFDDPDKYLAARVMDPLRQEGQRYMLQIKDGLSREMANGQFGEQAVTQAVNDLGSIRHTPQGDFVFNQIMASGHPYGALMRWHAQARAQQAIGPDPNAWLRQQQEQWINDPKVQAEAVKRWQQRQQQNGNRPPNVSLPPSLSSIPAAGGRIDEQGDLSNESLYRFAIK